MTCAGVDRLDRVEAPKVEHDLAVQRHRSSHQTGVAALGHDGRARVGTRTHRARDLLCVRGPHDRGRAAPKAPGPVDDMRADDVGVGEHVRVADDVSQRDYELGGHVRSVRSTTWTRRTDRCGDGCSSPRRRWSTPISTAPSC